MAEKSGFSNAGYQAGPYPPQQTQQFTPQGGQYPPQQPGQVAAQQPQFSAYPPGQHTQQQSGVYPPQQGGYTPQMQQGYYAAQGQMPSAPAVQPSAPVQWDPNSAHQFQGDIGEEDVDENAVSAEPQSGAMPPSFESVVLGYENVVYGSEASVGPPPSYDDATRESARIDSTKIQSISDEEAREALLEYVSQKCCYGKGAAENMEIKDIQSTSAYHYSLETFTESRSTKWHYTPYSGGYVDGPHNGHAPGPWDMHCQPTSLFKSENHKLEVPHTASVRTCHLCFGRGFNRCWKCTGRGRVRCTWCHGSGRRHEMRDGHSHHVHCSSCGGSGRKRCITCHGSGCVRCRECMGFGQIKQFIQLTVAFNNRLSDHIVERTDMPDHLIRDVTGDVIFEQIALRVGPLENFMEQEINRKAAEIVSVHSSSWRNDRVLQQRQKLRSVPVYECRFNFNNKEGRFWVYGNQRAVFTENYPHTCCCCTIL